MGDPLSFLPQVIMKKFCWLISVTPGNGQGIQVSKQDFFY